MTRYILGFLLAAAAAFGAAPTDSITTSAGTVRITPIEHAGVLLQAGGKALYVDPAQGKYDGLPKADYILITHEHGDHFQSKIIDQLKKDETQIVAPKAVAARLPGVQFVLSNGEEIELGLAIVVEAVPAYNMKRGPKPGELFHPKGSGNGYIVRYGGKLFYFSGDTEATPEMKALTSIDVAFVCMNMPYTMPPEEAAEAVKAFHPAIVYPYHYMGSDPNAFAKALEGSGIEVRIRNWYQ